MKQLVTQKIRDARAGMKASDDRRDAGLTTPEDVQRFDGLPYGPDSTWQILDVYRPRSAGDAPLPVIVNVHGGGWIYGTKETYQFYCMDLCRRGFAAFRFLGQVLRERHGLRRFFFRVLQRRVDRFEDPGLRRGELHLPSGPGGSLPRLLGGHLLRLWLGAGQRRKIRL